MDPLQNVPSPMPSSQPAYVPPTPAPQPVPTPAPQMPKAPSSPKKSPKYLIELSAVVVLLILAGLIYYFKPFNFSSTPKFSSENVTVSKLNIAQSTPTGIPADLPIEKGNITEQAVLNYPDRGTTLYSLAYTSIKQVSELGYMYNEYLTKNGYTITSKILNSSMMSYSGDKGKTSISVVVTPNQGMTLVKLAVVVRQ